MKVFIVSGCRDDDDERINIKGFSNISHANKYRKKQQKDYNDYLHLKKEKREFEDYIQKIRWKKDTNRIMKPNCLSNYSIAKFVDCLTYSKDVKCSVYEYVRDFKLEYVPKYSQIDIEGMEIE